MAIFNATKGFPPIAYTSESELAAAIAPNQYGSSTMGVKKSVDKTTPISSVMRYTPASSALEESISTFLSVIIGSCPSTWNRSKGLNFEAQPEQLERLVNLISIFHLLNSMTLYILAEIKTICWFV